MLKDELRRMQHSSLNYHTILNIHHGSSFTSKNKQFSNRLANIYAAGAQQSETEDEGGNVKKRKKCCLSTRGRSSR